MSALASLPPDAWEEAMSARSRKGKGKGKGNKGKGKGNDRLGMPMDLLTFFSPSY